jgi:ABC-2 type transport system permease protein
MSLSTIWTLFKRELQGIFVSPVAYVVLGGCSLIIGAGFSIFLHAMIVNNVKGAPLLSWLLGSFVFWFTVMIQTPLISMRALSEEYKMGTIEMLLTAPVREWEVVLAKFLAIATFYVVLWLPAALDISYLYAFSDQKFDLTWGMTLLPFLMVFLIGFFYIAIGIFASSLTQNQVTAAILGFAFIFLAFCIGLLGVFDIGEKGREFIGYISSTQHLETFCRGIFDSRPVVFYLSGIVFFLFLTQRVLESRRLRS